MRRAPFLLLAILLASACSQAPVAGPQAGYLFTLAAIEGEAPVDTAASRDVPTTPPPAPGADAPTAAPTPSPEAPSPSPGGVVYTNGGGSGGGGAPPPPPTPTPTPTPTPPGVAIAPADGGFRDTGASETGVVGP